MPSGGGKSGVGNRAWKGKGWVVAAAAAVGTVAAAAGEATLSFLITRVTLGGMMLLDSFMTTVAMILFIV